MNFFNSEKFYKYKWDYLILFIVCTSIRIYHINTIDLWGDEIHHFFRLHNFNMIHELLLNVRKTAIYAIVNIAYKALVPTGLQYSFNFIPRIPALIFGILTVIVLYDAFKRNFGNVSAFVIGCFSCASYPLIIYSIRSRVYSMTQFYLAVYVWFYVSIIKDITKRDLILFFIFAIVGFLTYPYLAPVIYIIYFSIGIHIFIDGVVKNRRLFICLSLSFLIITSLFLIIVKSSFSHPIYKTIPMSVDFFLYAYRGMISYYSGNSYILAASSFVFPMINLYHFHKRKISLNYLYLLWLGCSLLVIFHIIIVTNTRNAFNPRHVSFLAVPFITCVSYSFYEIYKYLSKRCNNRNIRYFQAIFLMTLFVLTFSSRDFKYYLRTGSNYHGGSNRYSEKAEFFNSTLNRFGKNNIILISKKTPVNYLFYFYRTNKKVVTVSALKRNKEITDHLNNKLHVGFILPENIESGNISSVLQRQYYIFKRRNLTVMVSKKLIDKNDMHSYIKRFFKNKQAGILWDKMQN